MATSKRLKAWVRYDGQKKIVPSSLILQANKPKVGTWVEISADLCCGTTPCPTPDYGNWRVVTGGAAGDGVVLVDDTSPETYTFVGPNNDDSTDGWVYLKQYFPTETCLQINYEWTSFDDSPSPAPPIVDWPVYWNSPIEPTGVPVNINPRVSSTPESGTWNVTIPAGQWFAIGVYSDDSCCGRGFLQIEIATVTCPPASPTSITLTWPSPVFPVSNPLNVSEWNIFFNLPANGNPFTSVSINPMDSASVILEGASEIFLTDNLFTSSNILSFVDQGSLFSLGSGAFYTSGIQSFSSTSLKSFGFGAFYGCLSLTSIVAPVATFANNDVFSECNFLTSINLPSLVTAGNYCFNNTYRVTSVNLPALTSIGVEGLRQCGKNVAISTINLSSCINLGPTVGNNNMFAGISGKTITLTVPAALMTCNSGGPDGDIQALQGANTVTVITV